MFHPVVVRFIRPVALFIRFLVHASWPARVASVAAVIAVLWLTPMAIAWLFHVIASLVGELVSSLIVPMLIVGVLWAATEE